MSSGNPETRERILEATRQLIENSQGKAVRLKDIADLAGVSRQAIYLHFGSRVGLMVAAVQHIDEVARFGERTQHVRDQADSLAALDLFIAFWADYIPTIYGVAKQLLIMRESDEGAAAAWKDRNTSLRNGPCRYLIERLEQDGRLDPRWKTEAAIDVLWTLLSIQTWESLVIERGWSKQQYSTKLRLMIQRVLIKA
ncbi:MAG: TetR/AcrR family transcriptional regulator [Anaerolineales bacterium]